MARTTDNLSAWAISLVDSVNQATETAMERTTTEGQEMVRGYIDTRGTANPEYGGKGAWSRTYQGKDRASEGRVRSGRMRNAIARAIERSKWTVTGSFGWLDDYQDYYGQQEAGFEHPAPSVGKIAGMFAMADAADQILPIASGYLDEELRNVQP